MIGVNVSSGPTSVVLHVGFPLSSAPAEYIISCFRVIFASSPSIVITDGLAIVLPLFLLSSALNVEVMYLSNADLP